MKVAALQMVSTPDLARNLEAAARGIAEAAAAGAGLVALPEYFCLLGRSDRDKLAIAEPDGDGPIQAFLSNAARQHGLWIIGGTLPMRINATARAGTDVGAASPAAERVLNASCVYGPDGARAARYDKIHLFAYDNGSERYDEGRTLQAGQTPVAFDAAGLRIGLSVCYDLRFPELYRALMRPPCDLIVVPSAFTYTTGQAHWELLLRARAIENQCYVLAPAQGGQHENGRRTWGHSVLIDPWGEVLDGRDQGPGLVSGLIDPQRLAQVRQQLPALAHRRL